MIFEIHSHPTVPGGAVVKCGPEGNSLVGRMFPNSLDRALGGYVVAASRLGHLAAEVERQGGRMVDRRDGAARSGRVMARPLPESACCGVPRRVHPRHDDCPGVGCPARIPPPASCPCGAPWVDAQWDPEIPPRGGWAT